MGSDNKEGFANMNIGMIDEDGVFHDLGPIKDFKPLDLDVLTKEPSSDNVLGIKKVIFNDPATIVFWEDGTKTVVKCKDGDLFSYDTGIYAATLKKIFGESYSVYKKDVNRIIEEEIAIKEKLLAALAKKLEEKGYLTATCQV